jgi:hypothetical protein
LPWAVGALSTHFGSLRAGFMVPLLGALSMVVFYLAHANLRSVKEHLVAVSRPSES